MLHLVPVEVGSELGRHGDIDGHGRGQRRRLQRRLHDGPHGRALDADRAVARQLQQVVDRPPRSPQLLRDAIEMLGHRRRRAGRGADVLAEEVKRRFDDAERAAQLVPDAGRELAHGGEALGLLAAAGELLAVRLQHDRELEIEDLIEGILAPRQLGRSITQPTPDDLAQSDADSVHGREHVGLGQADADVDAADAGPRLEVRVVVRPEQQTCRATRSAST